MATIGGSAVTFLDVLKQTDPKGKIAPVVEILDNTCSMWQDMDFAPSNDGDSHQAVIRTGLPSGTFRLANQGVAPTKGTTAQVRFQTALLEANSVIDRMVAEKGGAKNVDGIRANEARAHIIGLGQQMESALIYSDERTNPEQFTGLKAYYDSVSTATAASAENVVDCGGTGSDNTSMYLIGWGPNSIHGIVPEGSPVGLQREDKGLVQVIDSTGVAGATFDAYRENFRWRNGLVVKDWRMAVRLANIDISNLVAESSAADLVKKMVIGEEKIWMPSMASSLVWYCNRKVRTMLRIQALSKATSTTTFEQVGGKPVLMFNGIPVRLCDSLLNTEARVV